MIQKISWRRLKMTAQMINDIKTLTVIANKLDSIGMTKEANVLDDLTHDMIMESFFDDDSYDIKDDLREFVSEEDADAIQEKALSMLSE